MTKSRFPWKSFFHRSATAVFVLGPNGRLRYANPAWESLTGKSFAALRGTRISAKRESASPLWKVLAPPPETWAGQPIQVRRARPEVEYGPPWWDVQFVPLKQANGHAVIGFATQVGDMPERHAFREPEALASARADHAKWYTLERFGGSTPRMQLQRRQLQAASESMAPVWLHGHNGSGKETAARVIHHLGPHRERPFVALDCKALQPYMIEQSLFGRGGFSRSKAVGTLVLKHPEELPKDLQVRVLEWSEAKNAPRFIVTCRRNPFDFLHDGSPLTEGFLSRFGVFEIGVQCLANRMDDLPRIVEGFGFGQWDECVWPTLRAYDWLGDDIRGLRRVMAEAAAHAAGAVIRVEHLPENVRHHQLVADSPTLTLTPLAVVMENTERETIEIALRYSGGKPSVAAERLGMTRVKLLKRMKALGIEA